MKIASKQNVVPLILFPGMGADASIFFHQSLAFPSLTVPDWLSPNDGDDLTSYCSRMADSLSLDRPCILGGASFGGIVALEMTRHLDALACILIGSIRSPLQIPKRIRMLRPFAAALNIVPITLLQKSAGLSAIAASNAGLKHLAGVARQFSHAETKVLRWSARQLLAWNTNYDDVDIRQIHGSHDHVFPVRCVEPDEIVSGGGHVISMTHGPQVNEFIQKHVSDITTDIPFSRGASND
ncbi:MAG: alpha/beta hydrolase [Planctomycetota bacterium]